MISFINTFVNTIVPTATVRLFHNQKPLIDLTVHAALKARTTAYNTGLDSGDMSSCKTASYSLRKTVKVAKRRYRDKV